MVDHGKFAFIVRLPTPQLRVLTIDLRLLREIEGNAPRYCVTDSRLLVCKHCLIDVIVIDILKFNNALTDLWEQ